MSLRSEQLRNAIRNFNHVHDTWVNDNNRQNPDVAYWDAVDELFTTFDEGDMPLDCRDLQEAVENFMAANADFETRAAVNNQMPADSFWAARERLAKLFEEKQPERKKIRESVAELNRQGVGHEQIARMWGLMYPDGAGKSHLIEEELLKPGSVIGKDYVHPDDVEEMRAAKVKREESKGKLGKKQQQSKQLEEKPCPETPRELWQQRVGVPQAAAMLKMDVDKVAEMWAGWNIEREELLAAKRDAAAAVGAVAVK